MPGNEPYLIRYLASVVEEDIPALPSTVKVMVQTAIESRLKVEPIKVGKPLRYTLKGYRRLRVSDYRVIYRIDPATHSVLITAIQHRKKVYDDF